MGCGQSKNEDPTPDSWCKRSRTPVFTSPIAASLLMPVLRKKINPVVAINDNTQDCTVAEVQEKEYQVWHEDDSKDWDLFTQQRPYSVKGYQSQAVDVGQAKDAKVLGLKADSDTGTLLEEVKKLGESKGSEVVAVSFDSLTCPVWRSFGGHDLHKAVADKGFPVLHVYTREAHASDEFDAAPNGKGLISLKRQVPAHQTEDDRRKAAVEAHALISRQVGGAVDMVLDNMEDELEKAYEARPFRIYLLETSTGKVVFRPGVCPFNIPAKTREMQEFLVKYARQ